MHKRIHVHQALLKKDEPCIIVRTHKRSRHFKSVYIDGPCTLIHSPEPDHCGARVWIETDSEVAGYDESGVEEIIR